MKRETISLALNSLDDRHITDTAVFSPERIQRSPERIVYMKRKRIVTFALAAALMLVLGISAFAIWGIPRFTGTHPMPKTAEYTSIIYPVYEGEIVFQRLCFLHAPCRRGGRVRGKL